MNDDLSAEASAEAEAAGGTESPSIGRRLLRILGLIVFLLIILVVIAGGFWVTELVLRNNRANALYTEIQRNPPHPFLQAMPVMAASDHVNGQGFRGDEVALVKPPKTFRIFTIGGSTTLGVTNLYADTYPFLLQTLLQERYPDVKIEVQNAGCPWYTSAHALVSYTVEVRQYQPDLVIFFEAVNDMVRSFSPPWLAKGDFKPDYSHYLGPYAHMLGPNASYVDPTSSWLTWNVLTAWIKGSPDPFNIRNPANVAKVQAGLRVIDTADFRSLPSFRQYSEAIIHYVQSDGHAVMTASQPSIYRPDLTADERKLLWFAPLLCADHGACPSLAAMIRGIDSFNAAAKEIATQRNVPFIDFASAVPKTAQYFVDDVHMKKSGNAILAKKAVEAIVSAGLVTTMKK